MVRGFCLVDYKYYIGNNFCINVRLLLLEVTRTDLEGEKEIETNVFLYLIRNQRHYRGQDRTLGLHLQSICPLNLLAVPAL